MYAGEPWDVDCFVDEDGTPWPELAHLFAPYHDRIVAGFGYRKLEVNLRAAVAGHYAPGSWVRELAAALFLYAAGPGTDRIRADNPGRRVWFEASRTEDVLFGHTWIK